MPSEADLPQRLVEKCRIIVDAAPASGAWNMAVDEALLESAIRDGLCTVRCYQWDSPTLSLGYFQSAVDVPDDARFSQLPVVRRLSGGGAIVHHHELTYSCAVPAGHPLSREPHRIYTAVHERIIALLADFGATATFRGAARPDLSGKFLCFGRGDDFDVVMCGQKILGSAQRRRKGAILQHGSLILARSEFAPEFAGLSDLAGRAISAGELLAQLPEAIANLLGSTSGREALAPSERSVAASLLSRNAESGTG